MRSSGLAVAALACVAAAAPPSGEGGVREACEREVVELHRFFQDWFNGALAADAESFARFEDVLAVDFAIVSPEGTSTGRAALLERVRSAHGSWVAAGAAPGRVWIEDFRWRGSEGRWSLVTYQEWQEVAGATRGRLSTALLARRDGTPNGLEWRHVHEVWLPEG